jgi:hypothetical protein
MAGIPSYCIEMFGEVLFGPPMLNSTFGSKSSAGTSAQNLIDSLMRFFFFFFFILLKST